VSEKYISASKLKAHYSWLGKGATLSPKDVDCLIDAQPAADVKPVVRGWWVPNKRYDGCMVCDQCGFGIEINTIVLMECNRRSDEREFSICAGDAELAYCPNCGAHMERSGNFDK